MIPYSMKKESKAGEFALTKGLKESKVRISEGHFGETYKELMPFYLRKRRCSLSKTWKSTLNGKKVKGGLTILVPSGSQLMGINLTLQTQSTSRMSELSWKTAGETHLIYSDLWRMHGTTRNGAIIPRQSHKLIKKQLKKECMNKLGKSMINEVTFRSYLELISGENNPGALKIRRNFSNLIPLAYKL